MEDISTGLAVYNALPTVFNTMNRSINFCIISFESLQQIMGRGMYTEEIYEACEVIEDTTVVAQNLENQVKDIEPATQKVASGFSGWDKAVKMGAKAVDFVKDKLEQIGVMDLSGAFSTLDSSNLFSKTVTNMTGDANLANAALASLKDAVSGTAYGLDTASKSAQGFLTSGMSLGAATDQVRIWGDAVSFYGEGTNEQLESVVGAIGEMYSQGTVEPEQLNQLFDAGIGAAEIYAQSVNRSVSDVKNDLSNGVISAQEFIGTVSQALDTGASNGAAKSMVGSWAATFDQMKNSFTSGWVSIFESVDAALASQGLPGAKEIVAGFGEIVGQVMGGIANSMNVVIAVASTLFDVVSAVGGAIYDNWFWLGPIIIGIAIGLGAYLIATKTVVTATNVWKAAQAALNIVLSLNPIGIAIMLIIGLIAVIYAVVGVINHLTGSTISATGFIIGALAAVGSFILNIFIGVINAVIQFLWTKFVEPIISIVEFILNVFMGGFDSFGDAVANLIGQIISWFLSFGKIATKIIDAIFGTDWTSGLNSLQDKVLSWGKNENAITLNRDATQIDRLNYGDAYNAGYEFGEGIDNKVSKLFSSTNNTANIPLDVLGDTSFNTWEGATANDINPSEGAGNIDSTLGNIDKNTATGAENSGKIADSMDITEEDLKYLRDIAEREIIDRTVFQSLKVDMGGITNTVTSMADLDGIGEYLGDLITTTAAASMEG